MAKWDVNMTARMVQKTANYLAEVNPDFSVRAIQAFSAVAMDEGRTMSDYAKVLGLPVSTVSSLLLDLSGRGRTKLAPGSELLTRQDNPENLREVLYALAPKGRTLLSKLSKDATAAP